MNLPCVVPGGDIHEDETDAVWIAGFKQGHKSARHAAAELANEADAGRQELLEALSDARSIVQEYGEEMGAGPLTGIGQALQQYDALIAKHGG